VPEVAWVTSQIGRGLPARRRFDDVEAVAVEEVQSRIYNPASAVSGLHFEMVS